MWNREDLKQYQVLGLNLQAIMGGFGSFTLIASKFLLEEGIGTPDDTMMVQFEPNTWYPLDRFLGVFDRINAEFGNFTLRQVGLHVIKVATAQLPPHITDLVSLLASQDAVYHMNHAKNGQAMFNPQTGQIMEGIGHFRHTVGPGPNKVSVETDNPYPCAFDEGLLTGIALRFKPKSMVAHDKASCRSRGGKSCTYHITWK
jgi:hypothetical protein